MSESLLSIKCLLVLAAMTVSEMDFSRTQQSAFPSLQASPPKPGWDRRSHCLVCTSGSSSSHALAAILSCSCSRSSECRMEELRTWPRIYLVFSTRHHNRHHRFYPDCCSDPAPAPVPHGLTNISRSRSRHSCPCSARRLDRGWMRGHGCSDRSSLCCSLLMLSSSYRNPWKQQLEGWVSWTPILQVQGWVLFEEHPCSGPV